MSDDDIKFINCQAYGVRSKGVPWAPKTYPRKWELLAYVELSRLKIPGGWLVVEQFGGTVIRVPDPNHEWILEDAD